MTKDEAEKLFSTYFGSLEAIYNYFGVKRFDTHNYEFQLSNDNWKIVGYHNHQLHWSIPTDIKDAEGTYQAEIHGIFGKEFHTLVFVPSSTGDAGFALIFDNDKEIKDD